MAGRYTDQHPQFSDSNGVPLADGEIEFFIVGTTGVGNRKNTFSDVALTTPNPNPISLDGNGRSINPIFLDGIYNTIIRDVDLVQIDQVDNVAGPSSGEGIGSQVVNLVADLKPIDTATFKEVYVLGTTVIGDGGQGNFFFNATSVESDNGEDIIEPTVGGGRWLLQNNAHNSITTAQAAGTSDAITISTSPLSTALDSERVFFVENTLGANTITGVTFRVDTTTLLTLKRDNSTALLIGDTGPVGYKMAIQLLDDDSAYILINPFKATNANLADMAQSTVKGRAAGSGTGLPVDLSVAQIRDIVFSLQTTTVTLHTSNATYIPSAFAKTIEFEVIGAGGGSGGISLTGGGQTSTSGAGGAGSALWFIANTIDASYAIVVGAGGAGGSAGNNNGVAGGDSTITSTTQTLTSGGGGGGGGGSVGSPGSIGTQGTATNGDINVSTSGAWYPEIVDLATDADGNAATLVGNGGGVAFNNANQVARSGGAGFRGHVKVTEYI